jgi:methionine-rich copper-binding protein CopC
VTTFQQRTPALGRVLHSYLIARARTGLVACLAIALIGGALPAGAGTPAVAMAGRHTRLARSSPPNDTTLSSPPRTVTLWFTKPVQPKLSRLQLTDASGSAVTTSALRITSDSATALTASITGAMKPGTYVVSWSTTSRDSHVIKGTVRFKLTGSAKRD